MLRGDTTLPPFRLDHETIQHVRLQDLIIPLHHPQIFTRGLQIPCYRHADCIPLVRCGFTNRRRFTSIQMLHKNKHSERCAAPHFLLSTFHVRSSLLHTLCQLWLKAKHAYLTTSISTTASSFSSFGFCVSSLHTKRNGYTDVWDRFE